MRVVALSCLLIALAMPVIAECPRGPSTPEERAKALQIIRHLEDDPLSSSAKDEKQWLTLWLIEVPDIHVTLCTAFFPALLESEKNHRAELAIQSGYSMAAFQIEHPGKAGDEVANYQAGVEGTLKTYEAILRKEPKSHLPVLDGLLVKRDAGGLADFVREMAPKCNSK